MKKESFPILKTKVAGIDIGSTHYHVCVSDDDVKEFTTYTSGCKALIDHLNLHDISTVVIESTGVYSEVLLDYLLKEKFEVILANPSHVKAIPGKKSDMNDCMWLRKLGMYGLVKGSFLLLTEFSPLRALTRCRADLIKQQASCVNKMQKALTQMNIRLTETISDIVGVSGRRIIEAILKGQRDPNVLLSYCHDKIQKNKADLVLEALNGNYKNEYIFTLQRAYDGYVFYENQIKVCDQEISNELKEITQDLDPVEFETKRKPIRDHAPMVENMAEMLLKITKGNDPQNIPGITDYSFLRILSEVGPDIGEKFKTEKQFISWLQLCPRQDQSGKYKRRSKYQSYNQAGQIFRVLAQSIMISKHIGIGSFGRRIKARSGPKVGIKALAAKIARYFYWQLTKGGDFVAIGIKEYEEREMERRKKFLAKTAKEFGYKLVPEENEQNVGKSA